MVPSPKQQRLDATTAMMTKQGPEEMQRILDGLQARDIQNMSRQSTTTGASYPAGATGAMAPLYAGEDRNWIPEIDRETQEPRRGILSGPMDLPSKMYKGTASLLF